MDKQNNNQSIRRPGLCQILFTALTLHCACASADSLTDQVAAAFKHEDQKLQPTIKSDDEIRLTTPIGPITVFLDRVRAECRKRADGCDAAIKNLVTSTAATVNAPNAMQFNPDDVYPVVRSESGLRAMQATIGDNVSRAFVSRPYISGAEVLYAIDTPKAIRFVSASDLEHAGLTLQALDDIALAHVSRLPPLKIQKADEAPGIWMGIANDGYGTSRLFDPKFWDMLETLAGGPVAVALPTRDWLLAARLDDAAAISRLRTIAGRIVAGEPTAVTSALVRRDGQGWSEVKP